MFDALRKYKFFSRHPQLIPGGAYHIAIDAVHVHTYRPDSAHDCINCSFCLKRQRDKAIWHVHICSVAVLVCPGGLRLPLYVYPIHAKGLTYSETSSEDALKQECESAALPLILNKIRERFPKLNVCILLDSLYANGPCINLLKANRMEFLIVRKKGSMKSVGEDCDGLLKVEGYKATGETQERFREKKKKIERVFQFFNDIGYQNLRISILRFDEKVFDEKGVEISCTHWEWISSWKITKGNASLTAMRGRTRWLEEDLFNTIKNRGFHFKHDYSRNPNAQKVWSILIMIAFLITELFTLTREIVLIKGDRSLKDFMKSIFHEIKILGCLIFSSPFLCKSTQTRYCLNDQ